MSCLIFSSGIQLARRSCGLCLGTPQELGLSPGIRIFSAGVFIIEIKQVFFFIQTLSEDVSSTFYWQKERKNARSFVLSYLVAVIILELYYLIAVVCFLVLQLQFFFYLPATVSLMFSTTDVVKVLKHSVTLDWEWITVAVFFFSSAECI